MVQIDRVLENSRVTIIYPVNSGLRKDISGEREKDIIFTVESGDFRIIDNIGGFYTFSISNNVEESIRKKISEMIIEDINSLSISVKSKEIEMVEPLDSFLRKCRNRLGNDYGVSSGILWIKKLSTIMFDISPQKYPI